MAIYIMLVIVILMTAHSVLTGVQFLPAVMSALASISFVVLVIVRTVVMVVCVGMLVIVFATVIPLLGEPPLDVTDLAFRRKESEAQGPGWPAPRHALTWISPAPGLIRCSLPQSCSSASASTRSVFVKEQPVCHGCLLDGLHVRVERCLAISGIDRREHPVEPGNGSQVPVCRERMDNGRGVGQPCGLDHHTVEAALALPDQAPVNVL